MDVPYQLAHILRQIKWKSVYYVFYVSVNPFAAVGISSTANAQEYLILLLTLTYFLEFNYIELIEAPS